MVETIWNLQVSGKYISNQTEDEHPIRTRHWYLPTVRSEICKTAGIIALKVALSKAALKDEHSWHLKVCRCSDSQGAALRAVSLGALHLRRISKAVTARFLRIGFQHVRKWSDNTWVHQTANAFLTHSSFVLRSVFVAWRHMITMQHCIPEVYDGETVLKHMGSRLMHMSQTARESRSPVLNLDWTVRPCLLPNWHLAAWALRLWQRHVRWTARRQGLSNMVCALATQRLLLQQVRQLPLETAVRAMHRAVQRVFKRRLAHSLYIIASSSRIAPAWKKVGVHVFA